MLAHLSNPWRFAWIIAIPSTYQPTHPQTIHPSIQPTTDPNEHWRRWPFVVDDNFVVVVAFLDSFSLVFQVVCLLGLETVRMDVAYCCCIALLVVVSSTPYRALNLNIPHPLLMACKSPKGWRGKNVANFNDMDYQRMSFAPASI